jgi:hypothetical protein
LSITVETNVLVDAANASDPVHEKAWVRTPSEAMSLARR